MAIPILFALGAVLFLADTVTCVSGCDDVITFKYKTRPENLTCADIIRPTDFAQPWHCFDKEIRGFCCLTCQQYNVTNTVNRVLNTWIASTERTWFRMSNTYANAWYSYITNKTAHNKKMKLDLQIKYDIYKKQLSVESKARLHLAKDNATRRFLRKRIETSVSQNRTVVRNLTTMKLKIATVWDRVWWNRCNYSYPDGRIAPWQCWRDGTGRKIRKMFTQMVQVQNMGSRENGYRDYGEFWRQKFYERTDIENIADGLYQQILPLYRQMFVFVRRRLVMVYGNMTRLDPAGPVASSFIGNWDVNWRSLYNSGFLMPYPWVNSFDVTNEMKKQNYTVTRMYQSAEKFFVSLGFPPLPESFWKKSMLVKPNDRIAEGHSIAWDLFDESRQDVRISFFTAVSHAHLSMVHHAMGQTMSSLVYRNQPSVFRFLPNPGFRDAVGDVITLSFNTRKHMKKLGLLKDDPNSNYADEEINLLMMNAAHTIPVISLAYVLAKWRWGVYSGNITTSEYNRKWWELKLKYQGLVPPVKRSEKDMDAGYLYQVSHDYEYFRFFVSEVVKFQFYKKMCDEAGHTGPLHRCDFYGSTKAGDKFKKMIELGKSKPWWEALKMMTGHSDMSVDPLMEYFKPLYQWLKKRNARETISWMKGDKTEKDVIDEYFVETV